MDARGEQQPPPPPAPAAAAVAAHGQPQPQQQQQQQTHHQPQPGSVMMVPASYAAAQSYPSVSSASAAANSSPAMIGPNSAGIAASAATGRFPFGSTPQPASKPLDSLGGGSGGGPYDGSLQPMRFGSDPVGRKKRGRPRKYAPDGNIALRLATSPMAAPLSSSSGQGDGGAAPSSEQPVKKHRGRPPGSGKRQLDALGAGGIGFTPHVITVKAGEDIASKVMAFSQQGPRTVCILSANGAICNVTLRQPAMSGGTVTYEGRFEIISLTGSYQLSENNGNRSRSGGLSVSLAGSDGRVLGGVVAGMLMAATPVQVIVGSFIADGKKSSASKSAPSLPALPAPQMLNFASPPTASSPPSQGGTSESSDEHGTGSLNRGPGLYNNTSQPIHNMQMYHLWAGQAQQ